MNGLYVKNEKMAKKMIKKYNKYWEDLHEFFSLLLLFWIKDLSSLLVSTAMGNLVMKWGQS